ncbi:MAG: hypothetical protein GF368_05035 [Candidatus Aenigmarchaeota archaeon]|nr:hypothetical protein [Candidatus Aenigmarchaeota archaeon]
MRYIVTDYDQVPPGYVPEVTRKYYPDMNHGQGTPIVYPTRGRWVGRGMNTGTEPIYPIDTGMSLPQRQEPSRDAILDTAISIGKKVLEVNARFVHLMIKIAKLAGYI